MRNIFITVSYDGTDYCGWQLQPNGVSISEKLNEAIKKVTGESVTIYGSGRTDSGVHAYAQSANFHTESDIPVNKFVSALNYYLPDDIRINGAREVRESFNSRFDAKGKSYIYRIYNAPALSPFYDGYAWHVKFPLNVVAMSDASKVLLGVHDFRAFMAQGSNVKTTVREIYSIDIEKLPLFESSAPQDMFSCRLSSSGDVRFGEDAGIIQITITGSGFLYNMVRIITGTLVYVGNGKYDTNKVKDILEGRERSLGAPTAPACGLFLKEVFYDEGDIS